MLRVFLFSNTLPGTWYHFNVTRVRYLDLLLMCKCEQGGARSYNSQSMAGWLWWCYNENSHDTGGIVWDNWKQLDWNKLGFMINSLGLTPWYKDEFVAAS